MKGKLIFIIGPSGAGKDTLLNEARVLLANSKSILFAHRYITRSPEYGVENHIALSTKEFEVRSAAGLFSIQWSGNDLHYGIGSEIDLWINKGFTVVVNGSRAYLKSLEVIPGHWVPLVIDVDRKKLESRLILRSRESAQQIKERLRRNDLLSDSAQGYRKILNNGSVREGVNQLCSELKSIAKGIL